VKDWNDAHRAGVNIRGLADSAKPYEPKGNGKDEIFHLVRVGGVQPVGVNWLWVDRLARGKLTLLGGNPDLGKSQIATDVAARLSTGKHWPPKGARAPLGSTIFICSEDDVADTIRPRAEAVGANLDKLHVLKSTVIRDGKRRTFSLQHDLATLGAAVTEAGDVALVVLDAITTDVRAVLEPELCERIWRQRARHYSSAQGAPNERDTRLHWEPRLCCRRTARLLRDGGARHRPALASQRQEQPWH
jgi:AAA domain